uniref:Telomerase reverse transcriptase n=1 Tax=Brugia malayi TaxID=6279 RepID=A0A1I9GDG5_BRUMA|nr:Bm9653 [Brugia malayi]
MGSYFADEGEILEMTEQRKFLIGSRMCFHSTDHSWLNHRQGRMVRRILTNLIICSNCFWKKYVVTFVEDLSIKYSLKHTVPHLDDSDVESLLRKSVTYVQYRGFMRAIFGYLLPLDLIGKYNTKLVIDRISSILFNLGYDEIVRLSDLFSIPFKTSTIKWLRNLPSYELCSIHRKFLLWFLRTSFHITKAAFYVTPENTTRLLRFYRKDIWKRIESHSFQLLSEKRDLKKVKEVEKSTVGAQIRFLPKNSGTRSLIVPTGKSFQRQYSATALKIASVVIDLICSKQRKYSKELPLTGAAIWNGIGAFPRRFRRFMQMNRSTRIYAVKTDVRDCFHCINQNLLRSILRKHILLTKHFRLNASVIGTSSLVFARRFGFGCGIDNHNCNLLELCITGEMVIWFLETYVINKEFEYRSGIYRAFRGIPQGNHASTRLCDLYLGAADCERYLELMKRRDTLLIRYVDDYLLLTTDMNFARKFLEVMHLGADDSYNIIADSTKTVINFYCERSKLLISGKMVGSCSAVPWCGYIIYPGLRRYCIDWAKIHSEKAVSCRIIHKIGSHEKRIAVLKFLKASLLEKYRMVHRLPFDKWKVNVLKKFAIIGTKFYARPYARKVRLSMKGRWNRVFWQNLRAWLRQGFKYSYNTKLAHLYGSNS